MKWTLEGLKKLYLCEDFLREDLPTPEDVLEWFALLEAGWMHNGDPSKPHAKLSSGKCSNGFFMCKKVLAYGNLREILAACVIAKLKEAGLEVGQIHGVFGAPYSSILLAGDVGRLLGAKNYVPEKDPDDPDKKKMKFKADDVVPANATLLQAEELITTSGSAGLTSRAVAEGNPHPVLFAPFVGVLVYRPPKIERTLPDGRVIVPFIEKQVDAWDPAECPLCKAGSIPLPPKGENWAKLTV